MKKQSLWCHGDFNINLSMERIDGSMMIIMHMKHVRHTLYSVELLPENMSTKESRMRVKKLIHVVRRFMITSHALLHVYTYVIYMVSYVCNNNNFILGPSILTCLFCINHADTRIFNSFYA